MGRSPFFTIESIMCPEIEQTSENLQLLEQLKSLKENQRVKITVKCMADKLGPSRSISKYEYTPSNVSKRITYNVISTNYAPGLSKIGLVAYLLKDPSIPDEKHINGWVITSDGYIRETEHFSIQFKLHSLQIIE